MKYKRCRPPWLGEKENFVFSVALKRDLRLF